jgi:signal transduction histidine kinase
MDSFAQKTRNYRNKISLFLRFCHSLFLKPKSKDEETARREYIFNIIIASFLAILFFFTLVIAIESALGDIKGPYAGPILFFILFFGALLFLSRKGHADTAKYLLIGIFFLGTTYGAFAWGVDLPVAVLCYGVTIVISNAIVGHRFAFFITSLVSATMIIAGYLETHGMVRSDLSWKARPTELNFVIEISLLYFFALVISWLSTRGIRNSLERTRISEEALKHERDLLELKIEERTKELKAAQLEKMSQLYRFVEFGRLSSGIFHDLLNPLTAVSLSVEKLQEQGENKNEEWQTHIERAGRASKRIESFIQTAKKQLNSEGKKEIFSLEHEISDAIDLLLHKSRVMGVEIRHDLSKTTLVYGNSVKFFQIAANLISNAIDSYIEKKEAEDKAVILSISGDSSSIRFQVKDFGCGIAEEMQAAIFDPFFTTKSQYAGMGLGLSTTKSIVEKDFGGTIEVESIHGSGSTFTVVIPLERKAEDRRRTARAVKA